jgi:hypothetical protein
MHALIFNNAPCTLTQNLRNVHHSSRSHPGSPHSPATAAPHFKALEFGPRGATRPPDALTAQSSTGKRCARAGWKSKPIREQVSWIRSSDGAATKGSLPRRFTSSRVSALSRSVRSRGACRYGGGEVEYCKGGATRHREGQLPASGRRCRVRASHEGPQLLFLLVRQGRLRHPALAPAEAIWSVSLYQPSVRATAS